MHELPSERIILLNSAATVNKIIKNWIESGNEHLFKGHSLGPLYGPSKAPGMLNNNFMHPK